MIDNYVAVLFLSYYFYLDVADVEGCEELLTYLLEALKQHDVTKVRTSVLMFDYELYEVEDTPIVPVL